MNHYTWTYAAGEGKNYNVGLFHGHETGHVLIYCDSNILVVDFKVFESKKYSFFINDELCEIRLERRRDEMFYFFEIDKQTDTPRNRARQKMERRYLRQTWLAIAAFASVVGLVVIAFTYFRSPSDAAAEELLARQGREAVGKVFIGPGYPKPEISYQFVANNQAYSSKPSLQSKPLILLSHGMPLESGDEFVVHYVLTDPGISRIDFSRPTDRQLDLYRQRAKEKYARLHPNEAPQFVECMVKIAFDLRGIGGLADFYFQDVSPASNRDHNNYTFLRLTRDLPFQKKVGKECW